MCHAKRGLQTYADSAATIRATMRATMRATTRATMRPFSTKKWTVKLSEDF